MSIPINHSLLNRDTTLRSDQLESEMHLNNHRMTDRLFVFLMIVQWVGGILTAIFVAPYSWIGQQSLVHVHVWAAVFLGGAISIAPILLGIFYPGRPATRHVIAVSQALWGALLIHLSGGRVETHFHVFCSLAFITFYRDWKLLLTMTLVVAADHAIRGIFYPLSVYGVVLESPFRWIEHAAWVLAEDFILVIACMRGCREVRLVSDNQASLEQVNCEIELRIEERTQELRKKTEEAELFALVVKRTDNSVLILDAQGRIESVNDGFTRITGYKSNDVIGKVPIDVLGGPTTREEERLKLAKGIESRKPFNLVAHKHRKNGNPIVLSIEAQPIFDAMGRLTRYVQIERDITESVCEKERLQNLTKDLRESARELEKLSLVAKYTDNAVVITDPKSRIEWVNEGFTRVTGYTLEEAQGRVPGHFLQGPETDPKTVDRVRAAVKREEAINVEIINYHKTGRTYWLDIELRPIHDQTGKVVNFIAIESDITQRKLAERERERLASELQDAARQAGMAELAGDVLHNVGNALNSINVSTQSLREKIESKSLAHLSKATDLISHQESQLAAFLTTDKRGQQFPNFLRQVTCKLVSERASQCSELASLNEKIDHVKEIVASQAAFSHRRAPSELVSPAELLEQAIKMNDASLGRHSVVVIREYGYVPDVLLEKHAVLQILINLIKNAKESVVESGAAKPTITVGATLDNDQLKFIVFDNGMGIPADNLVRIFQHGFSSKLTGHGFGLHSGGNIAQELGGSLQVESDGVGKGAVFTLSLPLCQAPSHLAVPSEGPKP